MSTAQCAYCLRDAPESDLIVVDILAPRQAEAGGEPWLFLGAVCQPCRNGDLKGKWRDIRDRPPADAERELPHAAKVSAALGMVTKWADGRVMYEPCHEESQKLARHPIVDPNKAIDLFGDL